MKTANPSVRHLVLVGGGHAHVGVLRYLGMNPVPGLRITVVAREVHTPYSGMLPGLIAGYYDVDDTHIDVHRLASFAGARLIAAPATGLDLERRTVLFADRPPLRFDLVSLNTGSAPATNAIPGAAEYGIPVKPIDRFSERWRAFTETLDTDEGPVRVVIVGGGAGGVELAFAINVAIAKQAPGRKLELTLISKSREVPFGHSAAVQKRARQELERRGIALCLGEPVTAVHKGRVSIGDRDISCDATFIVTSAAAPQWPRKSGLATDDSGFIAVHATLQSTSHDFVFAAGDLASMTDAPRPKAGVFAVRQGPYLAKNLVRAVRGESLLRYSPQRNALALIATCDGSAIASRSGVGLAASSLWTLKDKIDRRFMRKFTELPAMKSSDSDSHLDDIADAETLERLRRMKMACRGCGAKVGAPILRRALAELPSTQESAVVRGIGDDAALIDAGGPRLLAQTVDWFPTPWPEPYVAGMIAAEHALGDVYAMGATPLSALALVTVATASEALMEDDLRDLLAGAAKVLTAAGASLVGGHTTEGDELAIGFSITGTVDKNEALRKTGMRAGQVLIATKAIGTGIVFAGDMRGRSKGRWVVNAIESMLCSSRSAAEILSPAASACTDITGFGLVGHIHEMIGDDDVGVRIELETLSLLDGALELITQGIASSLSADNQRIDRRIRASEQVRHSAAYPLLFDPQTAGGLVAAVDASRSAALVAELHRAGYPHASIIGTVTESAGDQPIEIVL